jgi:hypothetical protein
MFATTLGHVRPCCISIHHSSPDDSPETGRSSQVEKDDDIACVYTLSESPGIVAIHDPRVAFQHIADGFRPFCLRWFHPAGSPIEGVQMHNSDTQNLVQSTCKRRLARATRADYKNLSRRSQICCRGEILFNSLRVKPSAAFPRMTCQSDPESAGAVPVAQ